MPPAVRRGTRARLEELVVRVLDESARFLRREQGRQMLRRADAQKQGKHARARRAAQETAWRRALRYKLSCVSLSSSTRFFILSKSYVNPSALEHSSTIAMMPRDMALRWRGGAEPHTRDARDSRGPFRGAEDL